MCVKIKGLLKKFEALSIRHVEHSLNTELHDAAQGMIGELYVVKAILPLYQGREGLALEEELLLTGVIPKVIEKAKKYGFLRRGYK